jgi:hypothetical protein
MGHGNSEMNSFTIEYYPKNPILIKFNTGKISLKNSGKES